MWLVPEEYIRISPSMLEARERKEFTKECPDDLDDLDDEKDMLAAS